MWFCMGVPPLSGKKYRRSSKMCFSLQNFGATVMEKQFPILVLMEFSPDYSLISQKVVWEIHIGEPPNTRCPKLFGGSSIYLQEGYANIRSTIKTYSVM
ncbi:hypothetical protein BDL97_13G083900 [Sphagnum fallax]|nr:hypothetical protein BDL97_13G083900 [Sphagnum fallax]